MLKPSGTVVAQGPLQNNPTRLKCALLGLTTLKVALHKAKGTPLPDGLAGFDELELT